MSVRWIIDELRRPALLHAHLTLALYQHQRSSLQHVPAIARAQSDFWNVIRVRTSLPDTRDAELRFTVRVRPMRDEERAIFDALVVRILEPNHGFPHTVPFVLPESVSAGAGRIDRTLRSAIDYRDGPPGRHRAASATRASVGQLEAGT